MMRRAYWKWAAAALLGFTGAACSAILGLEAPPEPDGGSPVIDGGGDGGSDAGSPGIDAGPPPVCAPLDASAPDAAGTTYFPLTPVTLPDGDAGTWDWFDITAVNGNAKGFSGGAFDGRYLYLAARGNLAARYDTMGAGFEQPASWSVYNLSAVKIPGGFDGAVFDGRYVYFVPWALGTTAVGVVARFDVHGSFTDPASWASFDAATLGADGGAATVGFFGGTFDGRFLYLVPRNDSAAFGRVVRYDTLQPDAGEPIDGGDAGDAGEEEDAGDAGHAADAGDAGHPPDAGMTDAGEVEDAGDAGPTGFADPTHWTSFDVSTVNPLAVGFSGAVFDGASIYLVPFYNYAFNSEVHFGASGVVTRFHTDAGFTSEASWSTFDLTNVNSLATGFVGAAFDGRYVYLVPRVQGVVLRFDTRAAALGNVTAWSTYNLTRLVTSDAAALDFSGAAFDGRFVYFIPEGNGFATLVRYDTLSTFTADCAWSSGDLTTIDAGGFVPENFGGAVFDGQYLYLIPDTNGLVGRFKAKTPGSMPALPAFNGSFF